MRDFPEQAYVWRCGLCAFAAPRREEWDETPGATYCPHDGSPLERVSCPHCGAPVMWRQVVDRRRRGPGIEKARFCAYCGGKTAVREPRMRHGPKIRPPKVRGIEPPKVFNGDFDPIEGFGIDPIDEKKEGDA